MLKHKKIFLSLLIFPLFCLFSCQPPVEKYQVFNDTGTKDYPLFVDCTNLPKEINSGSSIEVDKINVTYKSNPLSYSDDILKGDAFFLCTSSKYPTNSVVKNLTVNSSTESAEISFFVAHVDESANATYVSFKIAIKVNNSMGIKPWVWYVVTAVVIFGVVGMVFFTKRYKEKH